MSGTAQGGMEPTRAERVRRAVMTEIVRGRVAKGDRLDEVRLAMQLGVSRTPVREAFRLLAAQGWVEARPHRGVFVVVQGDAAIPEIAQAVAEIFVPCVRMIVQGCDSGERQALAALSRLEDIADATPNRVLGNAARTLLPQFDMVRTVPVRLDEAVAAMVRGDVMAAENALRAAVTAAGNATVLDLSGQK